MIEAQDLNYEKSVLIGVITKAQPEEKMKEYLDELEFLTYTAGGEVLKRFVQRIDVPNPKTYIGTGKMLEVAEFVKEHEIGAVIFDDELSPGQQKNIERELKCKIVDRTSLILDIFSRSVSRNDWSIGLFTSMLDTKSSILACSMNLNLISDCFFSLTILRIKAK